MKRPWQVWLAFLLCGAVVAAAMGWLTVHALRADRERSQARAAADLEQRISLALWRMDTKLAPLIAEEIARPHFFYNSFITVEAPAAKGGPAVEQAPSPLMNSTASNVYLNFEASPDGVWNSPQAPPVELESLARDNGMTPERLTSNRGKLADLAKKVDVSALLSQLPEQPLPQLQDSQQRQEIAPNAALEQANPSEAPAQQALVNPPAAQAANAPAGQVGGQDRGAANEDPFGDDEEQNAAPSKFARAGGYGDFQQRNTRYQSATQEEMVKQRGLNSMWAMNATPALSTSVIENASRPLWVGDQLLLARRVIRDGKPTVQGSWLDWPRIKTDLLAETADLLPGADLAPVRTEAEAEPTRMLAGLPVRLVVTPTAAAALTADVDAPLRLALSTGWIALAAALLAVAGLLWGVLALSERRAAFVSSVTHELRTPLTTFRMYAEMLARDMAPPERRREYLETLRTEAERLTHLVENVLAYARLERGRKPRAAERTTPAALVERFEPRLAERAAQSGMQLECAIDDAASTAPLVTDVGVVEQILFNLVDNAAKYAARAGDRRIHLDVRRNGKWLTLAVRDHGPGFASVSAAERSAPFSKSAQEAAESAPGVGLGLALCRRLARELGGSLELAQGEGSAGGARVTLRLPLER